MFDDTEQYTLQRCRVGRATGSPAWGSELAGVCQALDVPFRTVRLSVVTPAPAQTSTDTVVLLFDNDHLWCSLSLPRLRAS